VASQLVRLQQSDPALWLAWDYAGRLAALGVMAAIPSARAVAFKNSRLGVPLWELALWIAAIVVVDQFLCDPIRRIIDDVLPGTKLGAYPKMTGWLYFIDSTLGLALVAASEEFLFRRCARHVVQNFFGDRYAMIAITSVIFGAYHWWTGIGNVVAVSLLGIPLMLFYRRSNALWPVVLGHYLTDVAYFG
jgi:membrane protease YdiL (CAAX protease family)